VRVRRRKTRYEFFEIALRELIAPEQRDLLADQGSLLWCEPTNDTAADLPGYRLIDEPRFPVLDDANTDAFIVVCTREGVKPIAVISFTEETRSQERGAEHSLHVCI